MIITREEDFGIMGAGDSGYVQCQECGKIHLLKMRFDIEDELYIKLKCPKCKGITEHLWVGNDKEDIYLYYNLVADPRYYNYNTK